MNDIFHFSFFQFLLLVFRFYLFFHFCFQFFNSQFFQLFVIVVEFIFQWITPWLRTFKEKRNTGDGLPFLSGTSPPLWRHVINLVKTVTTSPLVFPLIATTTTTTTTGILHFSTKISNNCIYVWHTKSKKPGQGEMNSVWINKIRLLSVPLHYIALRWGPQWMCLDGMGEIMSPPQSPSRMTGRKSW